MKVAIHQRFESFIEEQIKSGKFDTPEEVVNAGLARLRIDSIFSAEDLADLRDEVQIGVDQADRGEFLEFTAEEIINEGRDILAKRR